jgi:hypothetical protein
VNAIQLSSVFLFCCVLGACTHSLTTTIPHASIGDFTDHVLEPLALRIADEKIIEAGGALRLEHTPKATFQTVAGLLYDVPWIGKLLNFAKVSEKAQLEEELAWLESRRIPLKRELLQQLVSGTSHEDQRFTVCVDGVQRRYEALDVNRFTRLLDGPEPCEPARLQSLKRTQSYSDIKK